ncbi:Microtubule bundling protein [Cladophialophora chaetospira]|uniref:Microtubule bundling protein n=1 Tax=Cladophialophora chaetospira TaxID=386627 RepID=A0AA39CLV2_9EURO|nr:Microtubule bundling protein [Cladophialophora chaetospira]
MDTSYLTTQVTTIIGQLHSIFDEIGVPRKERESRETELFAALSETLHNQLRLVNSEKNAMTEEAQNIIKTIKQMEQSLDDEKDRGYDLDTNGLRVTYPLTDCLRDLKEKYNVVSRLHRERFEQVKKLVEALESYSSHLESSFVKIRLPPTSSSTCPPNFDLSPSYVTTLDEEFTKVYDEYNRRVILVQQISEEIVRLWSDLGIPQAQTDSLIVQHYRDSPEQLGLHQADLDRLKSRREKLLDERKSREKRLADVKKSIETLWDRLGIEEVDRKAFLAANRGCGLRAINEFEDELARLNELKRQNLHLFVEDARVRLQELWDALYFSEEEMLDFTPAFSDVYSDALLSAHEAEIERLTTLKEQRAPILAMVEKYKSIIADREALAQSANDASRLMLKPQKGEKRDPGKLLREEKMRKRIAKELPKVIAELTKVLQKYEDDYGRPFQIQGERLLDDLEVESEVKAPPPRSKTPNGLPPRSKTPAPTTATKPAAASAKSTQPARPASVMRGPPPRTHAKTPSTSSRVGTMRQQAAPASTTSTMGPPTQAKSPSKIPSRVPLGNLKSSPERRAIPQPTSYNAQPEPQQNYAQNARSMPPPRAPPPRMRDLFVPPPEPNPVPSVSAHPAPPSSARPASTISSGSNESSRYVRPMSPEDVYTDHERMSYMSTSLLNNTRQQPQHQYAPLPAHQADPYYQPHLSHQHHPSHSSSASIYSTSNTQSVRQNPSAPASTIVSRQPSNTSSNMTTATTASGSENWETYSDGSEMEPERDFRDAYPSRMHTQAPAANPLALSQSTNGHNQKRPLTAGPGSMAPPPAKHHQHTGSNGFSASQYGRGLDQQQERFREMSDENAHSGVRVEGSDAAWSTELEESY